MYYFVESKRYDSRLAGRERHAGTLKSSLYSNCCAEIGLKFRFISCQLQFYFCKRNLQPSNSHEKND